MTKKVVYFGHMFKKGSKLKIAVPVKSNKEDPAIAPLFGNSKRFAIIENGHISIKANPCHGSQAVIEGLSQSGVNVLLVQEMG